MIDVETLLGRLGGSGALGPQNRRSGRLQAVETFGPNPGALQMRLYVPPGLAARAPLVVVLHGCAQTADGYADGAGWLTLADRLGFAVLCPEQSAANNPNRCFNWFEPGDTARGGGEAASIREMVRHSLLTHDLDPGRVFVTGLSAGGGMTAVMLAAYPEVFAAGAIVAGLPYGAASNVQEAFGTMLQGRKRSAQHWGDQVRAASSHQGPWPRVSIWHGDADATVNPSAADSLASQWTDVHGLPDQPDDVVSVSGRPYLAWRAESGETLVELHRLAGVGHGAPLDTRGKGGCGTAGPFLLDVGVSSSQEIAAFWGLVDRAGADQPSTPAVQTRRPVTAPAHHQAYAAHSPPSVDVGEVISRALRAAGLMK